MNALATCLRAPNRRQRAFTLIELLVVIAVIAILAAVMFSGMAGFGKTVSLESAQATLANTITAARSRAIASNTTVRILIRNTATTPLYRRQILMVKQSGTDWVLIKSDVLPKGVYLLPHKSRIPSGLYPAGSESEWRTADKQDPLNSSALSAAPVNYTFDQGSESWEYLGFTAQGTSETTRGSLILVTGRELSPAEVSNGSFPLAISSPENVRGVKLSLYGIPQLINDRTGF